LKCNKAEFGGKGEGCGLDDGVSVCHGEILGFHSGGYEEYHLLGYDAM
jgi:hypothetical protein